MADTPEGAKVLRWKRQCRLPRLLVGRKTSEKYENTFRVQRQPSRLIPRESLIGGVPHLRVCVILISSSASVNICIFVSFLLFNMELYWVILLTHFQCCFSVVSTDEKLFRLRISKNSCFSWSEVILPFGTED